MCATEDLSRYGRPFIQHTYLHHLTRVDHRHNFSVYNTLLHLKSASPSTSNLHFESLAFIPQLFLSAIAIPTVLAKKDLASTMLAQTFAFVTFNKVCTSQVGAPVSIPAETSPADSGTVFPMVYDLSPFLPTKVTFVVSAETWYPRCCFVGSFTSIHAQPLIASDTTADDCEGSVAPTRLSTRIPW